MAAAAAAPIPSNDLNGPKLLDKYELERQKRLRPEAGAQYVDPRDDEKLSSFLDDPWLAPGTPVRQVVPDGGSCKFLIVGAGFGGILFAVKLLQQGYAASEICIVDSAGGFGGTWFWNRFPGLMCDVESYCYMPLLEEMGYMPTEKYVSGEELRLYCERVCDKYGLQERGMFQSACKTLDWEEQSKQWRVSVNQKPKGGQAKRVNFKANFVFMAGGVLSRPKLPTAVANGDFKGHVFHTARWDYNYTGGSPTDPNMTKLSDKVVGYLGTGATAIQAVPALAKNAKQLHVFQRTPSSVDARDNKLTDPEDWKASIATSPGWWKRRNQNFNAFLNDAEPRPSTDLVNDAWTSMPSFSALIGGRQVLPDQIPAHIAHLHALDAPRQDRIRNRVAETVNDPTTADALKAWYPGWCKRPCFHDEYLPAFNRPNVQLVDTQGKGIDGVSPAGVLANGREYPVDVLILGTGYASPTAGNAATKVGVTVKGRNGVDANDTLFGLETLHAMMSPRFPNMFFPGPRQRGSTANENYNLDVMSTHVAHVIAEAERRVGGAGGGDEEGRCVAIEPTERAVEAYAVAIMQQAAASAAIAGCTPSYINGEGAIDRLTPEQQMQAARAGIWAKGIADFEKFLEAWRQEGTLEGLDVTVAK
ncbi:hypothetical protein MBLNU230_g8535t1 [Neophaeotheca triangularis]